MNKIDRPLVSILTPTWNRANYLDRVWSGLNSQTYKNIEWIVCNDGSIDKTGEKLIEFQKKSVFPVTIISANIHIGKSRMDNEAVRAARGVFILWNDSDDYLLPHAIEVLVKTWNSIPEDGLNEFVGITALCGNDQGEISTKLPGEGIFDTTWNDLREKYQVTGDMLYFTRSDFLKKKLFPEVDFLIPEGVVWTALGDLSVRVCPEILQIKEYRAPHCISYSDKMEYCRGKAYAIPMLRKNLENYPKKLHLQLWELITYIRYCIHGEVGIREAVILWGKKPSLLILFITLSFALLLATKDILQGKVRKTHREFVSASHTVKVSVEN